MPASPQRWFRPLLFVGWFVFVTLPIAFVFGATRARLDWDGLGLYATAVKLGGAQTAGWIFCVLWLAFNAALMWQIWKRRDPGPSLDLDDMG